MDLTSGCPLWPIRDGISANHSTLDRNVTCDIVVLLDKRDVATGSTAACTGLLQHEIDLTDLINRIGPDRATRINLASLDTIKAFPPLFIRLGYVASAERGNRTARPSLRNIVHPPSIQTARLLSGAISRFSDSDRAEIHRYSD